MTPYDPTIQPQEMSKNQLDVSSSLKTDVSAVVGDASSDVVDAGGSEDMLLQLAQDYPGISVTLKKFWFCKYIWKRIIV